MAKYYYDRLRTQILPRNADVNLIIGARGLGKTYGVRRYMLEDYIKNNICFVEVTRYREENNDVAAKYFDRIIEDNIFPDYDFRVHNKVAEIRRNGDKNWRTCGYFIPLSLQQQKKKSTYVNVRNICMDEIIIDPDDIYHHYLRNEYEQLANLVDTVTRERADDSKLRKPRIFLLGNACDAYNPYFKHYDVPLEPDFGLQWLDGKTCIFDYVEDDKYAEQKTKNTVAGRMMKNNADVAAKNKFKHYNTDFLEKPHKHAKLTYVFRWLRREYGVYVDLRCGYVFVSSKYDAGAHVPYFAITTDDNKLNYLTANVAKDLIRNLTSYYALGYLRYDTVETQHAVIAMLRNFGVK